MLDSYTLLGVDLRQAAAWRRRGRTPTMRAMRFKTAANRHRKFGVFRRLAANKATVLFKSGVQSVCCHGVEVTGLSCVTLRRLRSWASAYLCPTRCSQTAAFVLDGDPTISVSTAVAARWAKEVWSSPFDLRAFSLPQLFEIFNSTASGRAAVKWTQCRGPVSATALELKRLGWTWPAATVFRDDLGHDWDLCKTSPSSLASYLSLSRARQVQAKLAEKVDHRLPVDPAPVQQVLRSRLLDGRQKMVLRR